MATKSSAVTQATAAALRAPSNISEANNAAAADKRISSTRRPLWSPNQLQAYGAKTRVQACNEAMPPMTSVLNPSDWNHSGAYGLNKPMAAK